MRKLVEFYNADKSCGVGSDSIYYVDSRKSISTIMCEIKNRMRKQNNAHLSNPDYLPVRYPLFRVGYGSITNFIPATGYLNTL